MVTRQARTAIICGPALVLLLVPPLAGSRGGMGASAPSLPARRAEPRASTGPSPIEGGTHIRTSHIQRALSAQVGALDAPGRHDLRIDSPRDGTVYVPTRYSPSARAPLIVWLHGAGGSGQVSDALAAEADACVCVVLAPNAREWTWDGILGHWGPDVEFIQAAMRQMAVRYAIDRDRVWIGGFSDGASYSLSLGISYGDLFRRVMAFSPGVMQPIEANGKPPIFISHGRQDATMPIDATSRTFVARLKALGYDVTYREYEGRHQLPPEILREAFEWLRR